MSNAWPAREKEHKLTNMTNTCRPRHVWGCMAYKGVHSGYNAGMVIPAISDMYDHTCDYDAGMVIPAISDMYDHTCDYDTPFLRSRTCMTMHCFTHIYAIQACYTI
jgi:hypothetical protein